MRRGLTKSMPGGPAGDHTPSRTRAAMRKTLNDEGLDLIFRQARTHNAWRDEPVDDALLRRVYDLARMGPTSANMCPMRIVFVKSKEAKEKLKPDRKST